MSIRILPIDGSKHRESLIIFRFLVCQLANGPQHNPHHANSIPCRDLFL
jgi:hypothetical protein